MQPHRLLVVNCTLSRGGFSDERVFELTLADGSQHIGAAPRHYCYTQSLQQLGDKDPISEHTITGKLIAKFIEQNNGATVVAVPDGSVVAVPTNAVQQFTGDLPDVPVRSGC